MVLKPETSNISPEFHVVFYNKFSTVTFIREVTIPPSLIDLAKQISQSDATENIELKDIWFTPDLEDDTRETPRKQPSVIPT